MAKKVFDNKLAYGNARTTVVRSTAHLTGYDIRLQVSHEVGVPKLSRNQIRKLSETGFCGHRFLVIAKRLGLSETNTLCYNFTLDREVQRMVPETAKDWQHWS